MFFLDSPVGCGENFFTINIQRLLLKNRKGILTLTSLEVSAKNLPQCGTADSTTQVPNIVDGKSTCNIVEESETEKRIQVADVIIS